MDLRQAKALEIAARMRITFKDGAWLVPSMSGNGTYSVVLKPGGSTCTCPNHELTGQDCKHVLAAQFVCERDYGGKTLLIDTGTLPKKTTYKQDWPAYTEAQYREKRRFQKLLFELCRNVPDLPAPKTGRRPHRAADSIFSMVFKVYSTFSARRFMTDLEDAHAAGYLMNPIPAIKVNQFMENAAFTPTLQTLIRQSALPLSVVETKFAPDSSGFSTSKFEKWFDHKYGCQRTKNVWVKAHIMVGVKTNVITAVEIKDKDAGDSPQFKDLVLQTCAGFKIDEVSADKAYLSHENLEMIDALGGTAFVPFKSNSVQGLEGTVWEKMFHYFQFRREEFLAHYHPRSNVESTFSAVKRKFGDAVRSKNDVAMKNEVLCKFLAHNICCLIQEQCELGIDPVFWQDEPAQAVAADIIPLKRNSMP